MEVSGQLHLGAGVDDVEKINILPMPEIELTRSKLQPVSVLFIQTRHTHTDTVSDTYSIGK
jgi:hypothetical protein